MTIGDRTNMIIETNYPDLNEINDTLAYREGVVEKLLDNVDEYLEFSTTSELIKLIAANL